MTTRSDHDKGEWLIPRTVRSYMAIDVDKSHKDNEILLAEYIGRDQNAKYPRQE